jgi:hypothetical protein
MKRIIVVGVVGFVVVAVAVGVVGMRSLTDPCRQTETADAMYVQLSNEQIDIVYRQSRFLTDPHFRLTLAERRLKYDQLATRSKEIDVLENQLMANVMKCSDRTRGQSGASATTTSAAAPVSSPIQESSLPDISLSGSWLDEGLTVGKCRGVVGRFTCSVTSAKHRYFEGRRFEASASVWNGEHFVSVPGARVFAPSFGGEAEIEFVVPVRTTDVFLSYNP